MTLLEEVAKAIWESQRARIKDQEGLNAKLTWKSKGAPEAFWQSYMEDAKAAIDKINEVLGEI